jgi:tetratricopeptide (TPR) repeat protein
MLTLRCSLGPIAPALAQSPASNTNAAVPAAARLIGAEITGIEITRAEITGEEIIDRRPPPHPITLRIQPLDQLARAITVQIDGQNPGSGVIVAQQGSTYWVLTAHHVLATPDEYYVITPDGAEHAINYAAVRPLPEVDLALVPFHSERSYTIATLGNYGHDVAGSIPSAFETAGPSYALTYGWDAATGTTIASAGSVVPPAFALALTREADDQGYTLFYTNLTRQGMSGGPVLDVAGRVIGIHGRSEGREVYDASDRRFEPLKWGFSAGIPIATFFAASDRAGIRLPWQLATDPPRQSPAQARTLVEPWLTATAAPTSTAPLDWANWGNQLYRLGDFPTALDAFDRALDLAPDFYPAWYQRGNVLYALGDPLAAIASLDQALDFAPEFAPAWRDRGALLVVVGRDQAALRSFDRALELTPGDRALWYLRGNVLGQNLRRYDQALASYDRALALGDRFAPAWIGRGKALYELGHWPEALSALDRAVDLAPEVATGWILRGSVLAAMQRLPGAIASFERASILTPEDPELWYTLALVYAEAGQGDRAIAAATELVRHRPTDPDALRLLDELRYEWQTAHP